MPERRTRATVGEVTRTRGKGGQELVVDLNDPEFQQGRWRFDDMRDLAGYLEEVFSATPSANGGVTGSMSRKGEYVRRRPDGTKAFTFGDPILDQVTSPLGEIVIGDRVMDLTRDGGGLPVAAAAGSDLILTGEEGGVERWASADGTKVEYRTGNASLAFTAWKESHWYGYWTMGSRITTRDSVFEAANVYSRHYDTAYDQVQVCAVAYDEDSDTDDDYLDEYDYGWFSSPLVRVESLCRAQWNGDRYSSVVAAGDACYAVNLEPWPTGWPDDWPPDTGAEVRPNRLIITAKGIAKSANGRLTVINHDPTDMEVVVEDAAGSLFSNQAGTFTLPANDRMTITVRFLGGSTGRAYRSRIRIFAGGYSFTVPIRATVTQADGDLP